MLTNISCMVISSQPSDSPSKLEPFEDYPSIYQHLMGLRKQPE